MTLTFEMPPPSERQAPAHELITPTSGTSLSHTTGSVSIRGNGHTSFLTQLLPQTASKDALAHHKRCRLHFYSERMQACVRMRFPWLPSIHTAAESEQDCSPAGPTSGLFTE